MSRNVKKMTHDNPCLVFTPCRCTKPVHSMGPYGSNPGGLEPLVRAVAKPCAWALSALDSIYIYKYNIECLGVGGQ